MFFNILALVGLALSQVNLNETTNTTGYAAESSYTLNCGEPVGYTDYSYGKSSEEPYSFDYGDSTEIGEPYLYEYGHDYTYSVVAPGLWATLGVAIQLLFLGVVVARRIVRGSWPPALIALMLPCLYAGLTVALWFFQRNAISAEIAQGACAGIIPFVAGFAIFKMALRG